MVSAYKQFPVSLEDRRVLRIATLDPSSHVPAVFGVNALPFGASGSVAAFLRTSASLWSLGALELGLCWGALFDDFPTLTSAENASSTDLAVDGLFSLLGVSYAKTGDKNKPFAPVFRALGVEIDLSEISERRVYFKHTPERKAELVAALDGFLQSGRMSAKEAESLKGRLQWFDSFVFGRSASLALHILGSACARGSSSQTVDHELRRALTFLRECVHGAQPLVLTPAVGRTFLIFTDGACEGDTHKVGTVGGVLADSSDKCLSYFGATVPLDFVRKLLSHSANPIFELELLGVLCAFKIWGKRIQDCFTVCFIDNEQPDIR